MSEDLTRAGMDGTVETEGADEVAQKNGGGPGSTLPAAVETLTSSIPRRPMMSGYGTTSSPRISRPERSATTLFQRQVPPGPRRPIHLSWSSGNRSPGWFSDCKGKLCLAIILCLVVWSNAAPAPALAQQNGAWNLKPFRVLPMSEYPWSAFVRVNLGGIDYCTGVLIGRSRVYVQAHCLSNHLEGRTWTAGEIKVLAGDNRDPATNSNRSSVSKIEVMNPASSFFKRNRMTLSTIVQSARSAGILTLDSPLGSSLGWVGTTTARAGGTTYIGYSSRQSYVVTNVGRPDLGDVPIMLPFKEHGGTFSLLVEPTFPRRHQGGGRRP